MRAEKYMISLMVKSIKTAPALRLSRGFYSYICQPHHKK